MRQRSQSSTKTIGTQLSHKHTQNTTKHNLRLAKLSTLPQDDSRTRKNQGAGFEQSATNTISEVAQNVKGTVQEWTGVAQDIKT